MRPNPTFVPLLAFLVQLAALPAMPAAPPARPSLVVLIVIDQFPARLLRQHEKRFGPGGFARLMEHGAWYEEAYFPQAATLTGVGHATIATGALSASHGIPGNDWYDRETDRAVYCVEDPSHHWVGGAEKAGEGTSPRNLTTLTFGDEWRLANGMRPRVIAISLKDRGSILLGGRLGKAFWYGEESGLFVSSTYYYPDGALPGWVADFNAAKPADKLFGKEWSLLLPRDAYTSTPDDRPYEIALKGLGRTFPHVLGAELTGPGPEFFKTLVNVPQGNDLILDLARSAIVAEQLGRRGETDMLLLSLTANDYCGHTFGPESLEYEDITLRTDLQLEAFFADLDRLVGLERCLIALTSDHGATPSPEHVAEVAMPVGRIDPDALTRAADTALDAAFGSDDWAAKFLNPGLFLRAAPMRAHKVAPSDAERVAADALRKLPGVALVFPRSQVAEGRLPATALARSVAASFHPDRSPDVFVVQEPYWYLYKDMKKYEGMHGSPYAYDAHVPVILFGAGVPAGRHERRVSPADIAPTVCHLLGIQPPASCEGTLLEEALPPAQAPRPIDIYTIPALPPLTDESGKQILVPVTAEWAGGPLLREPRLVPAFEGGFSALAPVRAANGPAEWEPFDLWTITDRGPNLVIDKRNDASGQPFGKDSKLFPFPGYSQSVLRLRLLPDRTLRIIERIPLRRRGCALSGLPSSDPARPSNETAYRRVNDKSPSSVIDRSPQGYDLEGLFEGEADGSGAREFWACDEYGPSLVVLDGEGNVVREMIPGAPRSGDGSRECPAIEPLPAVLKHRRANRGFEGLAGDRSSIYAAVQSPLDAAGGVSGQPGHGNAATLLQRIVRVDRRTHAVTMFAYDHVPDPAAYGTTHDEVKIGDIAVIPGRSGELLVHEYAARSYRHIYHVAIAPEATVLADEQGIGYEAAKIPYVPLPKRLVADLTRDLGSLSVPGKLEGLAMLDGKTLVLGFDNDYGFEGDDAEIFEMADGKRRALVATLSVELPVVKAPRPAAEARGAR
jgi:arylsulfatase A-like enzyme